MKVALIVAMASNRVIGINNKLPWYLPNDLKYFRATTMGKPILMGRKTFESIGKPLPGRQNIVITRDPQWSFDGVKVVHSLEQAVSLAQSIAELDGVDELMVIGGEEIYRQAFQVASRLYLTQVHAEVAGDAWFPEFDLDAWQETAREDHPATDNNPYPYSFVVLERD